MGVLCFANCQLLPPGESNLIDIEGGEGRSQSQTLAMLEEEQNIQQLEQRENAVRQLEADIMDVNQIFKDLANLVHDQVRLSNTYYLLQNSHSNLVTLKGEIVDSIESNVETSAIRVNEGTDQLMQAERYQVSASGRVLFAHFYFVFFCLEQSTEKEDDFNGCRCSYFIDNYHRHCARS